MMSLSTISAALCFWWNSFLFPYPSSFLFLATSTSFASTPLPSSLLTSCVCWDNGRLVLPTGLCNSATGATACGSQILPAWTIVYDIALCWCHFRLNVLMSITFCEKDDANLMQRIEVWGSWCNVEHLVDGITAPYPLQGTDPGINDEPKCILVQLCCCARIKAWWCNSLPVVAKDIFEGSIGDSAVLLDWRWWPHPQKKIFIMVVFCARHGRSSSPTRMTMRFTTMMRPSSPRRQSSLATGTCWPLNDGPHQQKEGWGKNLS